MSSQVVNAVFHLSGTVIFQDFGPVLITGFLVYVPINFIILRAAVRDGIATPNQLLTLFSTGAAMFAGFEAVGPMIIAASWSDQGLHTLGTFEAYKRISSSQKWLYKHGGFKWAVYYSDQAQKEFKLHSDRHLELPCGGSQPATRVPS